MSTRIPKKYIAEMERIKSAQENGTASLRCPRCGRENMNRDMALNALSRFHDICICDMCGLQEAFLPSPVRLGCSANDIDPIQNWFFAVQMRQAERANRELYGGGNV